jgi:hypothetical protein
LDVSRRDAAAAGYFFLSGEEAVAALSRKPKFYLWENRIIGEAEIVPG